MNNFNFDQDFNSAKTVIIAAPQYLPTKKAKKEMTIEEKLAHNAETIRMQRDMLKRQLAAKAAERQAKVTNVAPENPAADFEATFYSAKEAGMSDKDALRLATATLKF
jgi:hypothetical protein